MKINSLAVFCGSKNGNNPVYINHAKKLGTLLAKKNITLIYGGGSTGIMGAVADAVAPQAAPAVVRKAFRMVASRDLAQDRRDVLAIVRAVDAGHVQIAVAVRLARGVAGEPVGMRLEHRGVGAVRVHPREHRDAVLVGGGDQLAKQVPLAEECRAPVERDLRLVVGHDATGVHDDALGVRAHGGHLGDGQRGPRRRCHEERHQSSPRITTAR